MEEERGSAEGDEEEVVEVGVVEGEESWATVVDCEGVDGVVGVFHVYGVVGVSDFVEVGVSGEKGVSTDVTDVQVSEASTEKEDSKEMIAWDDIS